MRGVSMALAAALVAATANAQGVDTGPPRGGASELVPVTDTVGIGLPYLDLVVDPRTLPAGPYYGYDKKRRLVATVYMIPLDDMRDGRAFDLASSGARVDHIDWAYNPGHAGVPDPHDHLVLWHVGKAEQAALIAAAEPDGAAPQGPAEGLRKLSQLGKLPDFIPGLGTLYVDPKTLPVGPFLGYDREGRHVDTIYMVPLKEMNERKRFGDLAAPGDPVDHVDIYYNNGHPAVPVPHYHIVEWHIGKAEQAALKVDPLLTAPRLQQAPPPAPYRKASELAPMPDVVPGLGTLYVDPGTLPGGPYLAYARNGRLVATVYLIPMAEIEAQSRLANLAASGSKVDRVDLQFSPGDPGLPQPHYRVVLWHVTKAEQSALTK
jgi:hypothetical protein